MTQPTSTPPSVLPRRGLAPALATVALRIALLAVIFGLYHVSWPRYLTTSDASSFIPVAHTLAGAPFAHSPTVYDTRVFPGWPLILASGFALGLPEQLALVLAVLCSGLAPWLYARIKPDAAATWLLVAWPPAWLLATVHPVSEAAYFCIALAGCLAVRAGRWFWVGLAGGGLVLIRPFGIAWVAAFACVLFLERRPGSGRRFAAFLTGGAIFAAVFVLTNLHLYGDILHQLHVYARPLRELNVGPAPDGGDAGSGHWGWPFVHLLSTPFRYHIPAWKIAYVFGTVALFLALAAAAVLRLRRERAMPAWERAALLAFLFNTALSFCTGPYWGFHSVDRYLVWGLPGALLAVEPAARRWPALVWLLALGGFAAGAFGLWNRFHGVTPG